MSLHQRLAKDHLQRVLAFVPGPALPAGAHLFYARLLDLEGRWAIARPSALGRAVHARLKTPHTGASVASTHPLCAQQRGQSVKVPHPDPDPYRDINPTSTLNGTLTLTHPTLTRTHPTLKGQCPNH